MIPRYMLFDAIGCGLMLVGCAIPLVYVTACTPADRASAARTALDAVDKADQTCADLREALHRDAGAEGGP